MGRPLYSSILLARQVPPVKESLEDSQQPQAPVPVVEKWSRWNAFDPDSDEFFQSEDAVYEAFLTEEQIEEKERAERDERARLTAERMMREGIPASSGVVERNDLAEVTHRAPASGIELYFMGSRAIGIGEGQTRTQPTGASRLVIPQINVAPSDSQNEAARSPSPDPLNLVSGLPHLSESPGPMELQELPSDPVSPVPDTPARVSGIFNTTPSPRPREAGPVTSQFLTLYDQLGTPAWDNAHRYRLPPVPAPLTS